MGFWQRVGTWLDPAATAERPAFTLDPPKDQDADSGTGVRRHLAAARDGAHALERRIDRLLAARRQPADSAAPERAAGDLSAKLDENLARLKLVFQAPNNADLIIRSFRIGLHPPVPAAVVFMEGLADKQTINEAILKPLLLLAHLEHHLDSAPGQRVDTGAARPGAPQHPPLLDRVLQELLPGNQAEAKPDLRGVLDGILYGDAAIFLEGVDQAILVETKGFPVRSVDRPQQEMAIRGAMDSFVEAFRVNVALVRRRLKDPRLVTEMLHVGQISRTYVALLHLSGVANPQLVAEVKRRVSNLKVDVVPESGILEHLVEDSPGSIFPQTLATERPDRVAAYLSEGHVALIVDNSPFALILPTTWWALMQTPEDYTLRAPFGTLLRWVRLAAALLAVLAGGLYVAAVNFHHEMIPTELMLSIAAAREAVPFPAVGELLLMEFTFELLREAGIRIPSPIGPIIGIVGALILGEAAVSARIISPVVVIIFAVSGLASFAIPSYSLSFSVRILRFVFIALAAVFGIYGIALGLFMVVVHLASLRSFGVPYLAPVAPRLPGGGDILMRAPVFTMEERPAFMRPVDRRRQGEPARAWDPAAPRRPRPEQRDGDDSGSSPDGRGPVH